MSYKPSSAAEFWLYCMCHGPMYCEPFSTLECARELLNQGLARVSIDVRVLPRSACRRDTWTITDRGRAAIAAVLEAERAAQAQDLS